MSQKVKVLSEAERKIVGLKRRVTRMRAQNNELRRLLQFQRADYDGERRARQRWEARCRQLEGLPLNKWQREALRGSEDEGRLERPRIREMANYPPPPPEPLPIFEFRPWDIIPR